jgi:hypothetical protein
MERDSISDPTAVMRLSNSIFQLKSPEKQLEFPELDAGGYLNCQ